RRGARLVVDADRLAERRRRVVVRRIRARYTRQTGVADVLLQRTAALRGDLRKERRGHAAARTDDRGAALQLAAAGGEDLVGNAHLALVRARREHVRDGELRRVVAVTLAVAAGRELRDIGLREVVGPARRRRAAAAAARRRRFGAGVVLGRLLRR